MAILRCTICGGELEFSTDWKIGVCKYCGSTITIPKNLDRIENLYNRAVFLRQNNEFYQAISVYEEILREDNTDADAHWGMVLSKYGIEYVEDQNCGKMIPTCHRMLNKSILSDPDYIAALQFANEEAKKVYISNAETINHVQSQIIEMANKGEEYDIFICYKETGSNGDRTEESVLAQDIYKELVQDGYKVFFARKTLENKLGMDYEPVIFSALRSARVMLVLGTKKEYFEATWVRNEWSRYLAMDDCGDKVIIPLYKSISPYELPIELSHIQGLDMTKIGFKQDLMDSIERVFKNRKDSVHESATNENLIMNNKLEKLVSNAETYQKLGDLSKAEEIYEKITTDYPEDYRGWWGRIVCETNEFKSYRNACTQYQKFPDQETYIQIWFRYIKQLSENNDIHNIEQTYKEYIDKIVEEIVNRETWNLENGLKEMEDKLHSDISEKKRLQNECQQQIKSYEDSSRYYAQQKEEAQKTPVFSRICQVIGIIVTLYCVIGCVGNLFAGGQKTIIGIFGFLIFALPAGWITSSIIKSADTKKSNALNEITKQCEKEKIAYDNAMKSMKEKISELETSIGQNENRITVYKNYYGFGKEKIKNYWIYKLYFSKIADKNDDNKTIENDENYQIDIARNRYYNG